MIVPADLLPGAKTVPFARDLASHGDRIAVVTPDGMLSYRELAARVGAAALRLGRERRLVLLPGANTLDALVIYLAALSAGHPVLLVPGDNPEAVRSLVEAYDPDVVVSPEAGGQWALDERRAVSAHALHPDLALLLSTSGSTGSPKLVRLSHANLQANAESIAEYLGIRDSDRAATTLPMHYCYGLSVIHSHLLRGAGLILTDLSVADSCFWELFREGRGSTFAGVPYTFDLLDRVGFATMPLPHLRYVTQAGGRLAPDRVTHYAELGRSSGWDLFVMYGQTEATARMAYLPPDLAPARPQAIGVPIPGGSFRLQPLPDRPEPDTGELVYAGPNVMLGYAHSPDDLRLGRSVEELHTGDIARRTPDGLYELVGRRSRFAKILGLRIDPQRVEAILEQHAIASCCIGADDELVVAVAGDADPGHVRRLVTDECGLPARAVRVCVLDELPRLATGKPDYRAVRESTRPTGADTPATIPATTPAAGALPDIAGPAGPADLCRLYAGILDRNDVTEDSSFVSLGGDSLSYVEMSLNLEEALGQLPDSWHTMPIRELKPPAGKTGKAASRRRTLETSVALRAVAIVLIAGSHIHLFMVKGGAHVLLGVAGYNFARFHLTSAERRERVRMACRSVARIAVPSMAWLALMLLVTDDYQLTSVFLLTSLLGEHDGFWFIEALVYILVAMAAVLAVPLMDRTERRFPFALPTALMTLGLVGRYDVFGLDARGHIPLAVSVFWLFAMGWAAARATTVRQRLLVTAAALVTVPGFFGQPTREVVIIAGLTLLIWVRNLPSLASVNRVAGILAGSSLYIYVTHWQVFPRLEDQFAVVALIASLLVGIAYGAVATRLMRWLPSPRGRRTGGKQGGR